MVRIDNSTLYNSLYRIQSQMKSLSSMTALETSPYIYNRNLSSTLLPSQLLSKISSFQQDNFNLNQHLVTQIRSEQLTQTSNLLASQPKEFSTLSTAPTMSNSAFITKSMTTEPLMSTMSMSMISSEGGSELLTLNSTGVSTQLDYRDEAQYRILRNFRYQVESLTVGQDTNSGMYAITLGKLSTANQEFRSVSDEKYFLENFGYDTDNRDMYLVDEAGRNSLLGIIDQSLASMTTDGMAELAHVTAFESQADTKPTDSLNKLIDMWSFVTRMPFTNDITLNDDARQRFISLNDEFKAITAEEFHLENTHSFNEDNLRTYQYSGERDELLAMIKDNIVALGGTSSVFISILEPPMDSVGGFQTTESYVKMREMWDYVQSMPISGSEIARSTRYGFNDLNDAFKLVADKKYHLENTHGHRDDNYLHYADENGRRLLLNMISINLHMMEADYSATIEPPVAVDPDSSFKEAQILLTDLWNYAIRMPMTVDTIDERHQTFLKLNAEFEAVADEEFHITRNLSVNYSFDMEVHRQALLEELSDKLVAMGVDPSEIMDVIKPPEEIGADYQSSEEYIQLRKMWDYAFDMSPTTNSTLANNLRSGFNKLNTEYKQLADSQYHLETTHKFSTSSNEFYNNKEIGQYVLLSMISENLHAMKRDAPPVIEPPVIEPPISNPPELGLDALKDRVNAIKIEYNNNQISVHSQEYNRLMEATEAKVKSELTKLQLLEQTNLWLLDNNAQRKVNISSLINN